MTKPSPFDDHFFKVGRDFIEAERKRFIGRFLRPGDVACEIGSQNKFVPVIDNVRVYTLDITPDARPDILADITKTNSDIPDDFFDVVFCVEVLEHVVDPFSAVSEIRRITKPGGRIFVSTPLNARIHGPVPDCWRFTEFGLQVLFRDFEILEFNKLDTPDRTLFPLQYCLMLRNTGQAQSDPRLMKFSLVD